MGLISDRGTGYDPRRRAGGDPSRAQRYGHVQDGYRRPLDAGYDDGGGARGDRHVRDDAWTGEYGTERVQGYSRLRRHHVRRRRRARMPVPVVAVVAVVASVAVVAAAIGASRMLTAHNAASAAPALNTNCTLIVPANPLTAQGLATPYQLTATDPADGPCNEANANQTAFVQGAVIDPATGQISVYNPLVIDAGTAPAIAPVVPSLPADAVVAVWFGFNAGTLSLAGPDQAPPPQASASPTAASPSASSAPATVSGTPSATAASPTASDGTPTASVSPSGTGTSTASGSASPTATGQGSSSPSAPDTAPATDGPPATSTGAPSAATQAEGAAPLSPGGSNYAQYSVTLSRIGQSAHAGGPASGSRHRPAASPPASAPGTMTASAPASAPGTMTASPSASAASPTTSAPPTASAPPTTAGDTPAASATPDAILQQANCVAGEDIGGQFSSFTQVGACNAVAFFTAANRAIRAGRLRVPSPGIAADGKRCLTTRSFALIDQDQSDNVTTEYLAQSNGQTAQDTAANRQSLASPDTLFNGSDNGLLDLFVDPALGCSPWEAPNLADGGAPAPALPLDEIQAARYGGGRGNPAALVPLNDPMTLDNNGQFSTDKTNTYRSLVDMPPLPAGQSPRAYCSDMERIQGSRLQQDVNLLTQNPGPAPDAADNLFTFLAMRLQQSFGNLNCGSFGLQNDLSTTVDGNGVVVGACFAIQAAPITSGPGNPMAGTATCPATVAPSSPVATASQSQGPAAPAPSATATSSSGRRHHSRHHWWW